MAKFGLYTNQGNRITITEHKDMKEALEYYSKTKQLPMDVFKRKLLVPYILKILGYDDNSN